VQAAERAAEERERQRKLRAAQQDNMAEQYFEQNETTCHYGEIK
jgi:hypothetical protein